MGSCYAYEEGCLVESPHNDDAARQREAQSSQRSDEASSGETTNAETSQAGGETRVEVEYANWPVEVLDAPYGAVAVTNLSGEQVLLPADLALLLQLPEPNMSRIPQYPVGPSPLVVLKRTASHGVTNTFYALERGAERDDVGEEDSQSGGANPTALSFGTDEGQSAGDTVSVTVELTGFWDSALAVGEVLAQIAQRRAPGLPGLDEAMAIHLEGPIAQLGAIWAAAELRKGQGGQQTHPMMDQLPVHEKLGGELGTAMSGLKAQRGTAAHINASMEVLMKQIEAAIQELEASLLSVEHEKTAAQRAADAAELATLEREAAAREKTLASIGGLLTAAASGGPGAAAKAVAGEVVKSAAKGLGSMIDADRRNELRAAVKRIDALLLDQKLRIALLEADADALSLEAIESELQALGALSAEYDSVVASSSDGVSSEINRLARMEQAAGPDAMFFGALDSVRADVVESTAQATPRLLEYRDFLESGEWQTAANAGFDVSAQIREVVGDADGLTPVVERIDAVARYLSDAESWLQSECQAVVSHLGYMTSRNAMTACGVLAEMLVRDVVEGRL